MTDTTLPENLLHNLAKAAALNMYWHGRPLVNDKQRAARERDAAILERALRAYEDATGVNPYEDGGDYSHMPRKDKVELCMGDQFTHDGTLFAEGVATMLRPVVDGAFAGGVDAYHALALMHQTVDRVWTNAYLDRQGL